MPFYVMTRAADAAALDDDADAFISPPYAPCALFYAATRGYMPLMLLPPRLLP